MELGAGIVSFVGLVLAENHHIKFNVAPAQANAFALSCLVLLAVAISRALMYTLVRSVRKERVHFMVSVLVVGFAYLVLGALAGGASLSKVAANPEAILLVIAGCSFGIISTCCLHKAFGYCRVGTGLLICSVQGPISHILSVLLGELPHITTLAGSALVIACTVVVGLRSVSRKSKSG